MERLPPPDSPEMTMDVMPSRFDTSSTRDLNCLQETQPVILSVHKSNVFGGGAISAPFVAATEKGWSVRETERRARRSSASGATATAPDKTANVRDLERRLRLALGVGATVHDRKGRGHIALPYASYDELDQLLAKLL